MKYILILFLFLAGCAPKSNAPDEVLRPETFKKLSWEDGHNEREAWSSRLRDVFKKNLTVLSEASDLDQICSNWDELSDHEKVTALSEFWIMVAKYESDWDPKQHSVDVGTQDDRGSWSVGLYQLSANDSANAPYKYSFYALQQPEINIFLSVEILKQQVQKTGKIFLTNSDRHGYWAVILLGNRHSKIRPILAATRANAAECE